MTAVLHVLTEPEAAAISAVLRAVVHIPVDADCCEGGVSVCPCRELTTAERVTVFRAFMCVTDGPVVLREAVPHV